MLESLTLSRWQMEIEVPRLAQDAAAILGPNLRYFGWCFNICNQASESCTDFESREENWLRHFLTHAKARKSKLARVFIRFRAGEVFTTYYAYPWDLMDKISEEFQPQGINIKYSLPPLARDEWMTMKEGIGQAKKDADSVAEGHPKPAGQEVSGPKSIERDTGGSESSEKRNE